MSKTNHAKSSRGSEIDGKTNYASDTNTAKPTHAKRLQGEFDATKPTRSSQSGTDTTKASRKTANEWTDEIDVDDYIKGIFAKLKLAKNKDYYEKTGSPYMQEALKGTSERKMLPAQHKSQKSHHR